MLDVRLLNIQHPTFNVERPKESHIPVVRTMTSPFPLPQTNPTPIFEAYRGSYATELLTAAVAHFDLFTRMAGGPRSFDDLRRDIALEVRPATVLVVALRAMGLLTAGGDGLLNLTPLAREHLVPGGPFYVGDYVGLAADSPGVREMAERL